MGTTGLKMRDVEFHYTSPRLGESFRLQCKNLEAPTGQVTFIIGGNGTGKTTLLRLAAGERQPAAGHVALGGKDLSEISEREKRQRIGLIDSSGPSLLVDRLLVRDHLLLATQLSTSNSRLPVMSRSESAMTTTVQYLDELGMPEITQLLNNRASELSAGQRQLLFMALVIAGGRDLLLADESTANLDAQNARRFLRLLGTRARQNRMAVVAVTHDLTLASEFAERCYATSPDGSVAHIDLNGLDPPRKLQRLSEMIKPSLSS